MEGFLMYYSLLFSMEWLSLFQFSKTTDIDDTA